MDPIAHASVGMMAKRGAPKVPLWMMIAATQVPDALFFLFEALGLEYQAETETSLRQGLTYLSQAMIPWSHGLVMCIVWSGVAAGIAWLFFRELRSSLLVGAMVLSHWLLDFIVYPNIPLLFSPTPMIGLGLITSGPGFIAGIVLEVALIGGGIYAFIKHQQRVKQQ